MPADGAVKVVLGALVATHLAAGGLGYLLAPRQLLDVEAKHTGWFRVDVTHVLETTVESIRDENQLLVFSYKGSARVSAERTVWWILGGVQELEVPAAVNYYVDLSKLDPKRVEYDARARIVTVHLPRVTIGDIAFQPEAARTVNGGTLTWSQRQVDALQSMNYLNARRAMIAAAQQPALVNEARRQAIADVQKYFEIPLRVAGLSDVKVGATFE